MPGKFIVFEGCEGVGKSTQLRLLKDYLTESGQPAVFTREPGGTPLAEAVRNLILDRSYEISPVVEAYLFATARADHVRQVIMPALRRGELVICDRFLGSSFAYQGYARGLGFEVVKQINSVALEGCLPDCTVFIDMDPAVSWRKQNGKTIADDRIENESMEFHGKVYEGYQRLAETDPAFVSVKPLPEKAATHRLILEALKQRGLIR